MRPDVADRVTRVLDIQRFLHGRAPGKQDQHRAREDQFFRHDDPDRCKRDVRRGVQ
jgi:hypothetical protein